MPALQTLTTSAQIPLSIVRGEGAVLFDADGRPFWDFYGGHAVALLGQGHPRWVDALTRQAQASAGGTAGNTSSRATRILSIMSMHPCTESASDWTLVGSLDDMEVQFGFQCFGRNPEVEFGRFVMRFQFLVAS